MEFFGAAAAESEPARDFSQTPTPKAGPPASEVTQPLGVDQYRQPRQHDSRQGDRSSAALLRPRATLMPLRRAECRASCVFGAETERHHRRLKAIENDPAALLELMELAVTWPELDYSETPIIPPDLWGIFFESHRWARPQRVGQMFSVAMDIFMMAMRGGKQRRAGSDHRCRSGQAVQEVLSDDLRAIRNSAYHPVTIVVTEEALCFPVYRTGAGSDRRSGGECCGNATTATARLDSPRDSRQSHR